MAVRQHDLFAVVAITPGSHTTLYQCDKDSGCAGAYIHSVRNPRSPRCPLCSWTTHGDAKPPALVDTMSFAMHRNAYQYLESLGEGTTLVLRGLLLHKRDGKWEPYVSNTDRSTVSRVDPDASPNVPDCGFSVALDNQKLLHLPLLAEREGAILQCLDRILFLRLKSKIKELCPNAAMPAIDRPGQVADWLRRFDQLSGVTNPVNDEGDDVEEEDGPVDETSLVAGAALYKEFLAAEREISTMVFTMLRSAQATGLNKSRILELIPSWSDNQEIISELHAIEPVLAATCDNPNNLAALRPYLADSELPRDSPLASSFADLVLIQTS